MNDFPNITRAVKEKAADPKWSIPVGAGLACTVLSGLGSGLVWGGLIAGGMYAYRKYNQ
jgi:hypothetical protein